MCHSLANFPGYLQINWSVNIIHKRVATSSYQCRLFLGHISVNILNPSTTVVVAKGMGGPCED
jgi:hypothetical protein